MPNRSDSLTTLSTDQMPLQTSALLVIPAVLFMRTHHRDADPRRCAASPPTVSWILEGTDGTAQACGSSMHSGFATTTCSRRMQTRRHRSKSPKPSAIRANIRRSAGTVTPFYVPLPISLRQTARAGHSGARFADYDTATRSKIRSPARTRPRPISCANAHAIAEFLSGASPSLPEDAVFGLLSSSRRPSRRTDQ